MGRRSRKRDRGPAGARVAPQRATPQATSATSLDRTRLGRRAADRPKAVWHPIPVSEIAIAGGLLLFVLGLARGEGGGAVLLGTGTLLATGGVIELTAREHFAGYRSHVLLLSFLPVVAGHTVVTLWVYEDYRGPLSLLVDAAVMSFLALFFLDRYRKAQKAKGARA